MLAHGRFASRVNRWVGLLGVVVEPSRVREAETSRRLSCDYYSSDTDLQSR